jgi:hypothetical protein
MSDFGGKMHFWKMRQIWEFQFANPELEVETWHVLDYPSQVVCLGNKTNMGTPWFANLKPKWKLDTLWIIRLKWHIDYWKQDKYGNS